MKENINKYESIWREQLPSILNAIRNQSSPSQTKAMPARQFESVGNRQNYSFRLDLSYGEVTNNIGETAVARDLRNVLQSNSEAMELLKNKVVTIRMNKNFNLAVK